MLSKACSSLFYPVENLVADRSKANCELAWDFLCCWLLCRYIIEAAADCVRAETCPMKDCSRTIAPVFQSNWRDPKLYILERSYGNKNIYFLSPWGSNSKTHKSRKTQTHKTQKQRHGNLREQTNYKKCFLIINNSNFEQITCQQKRALHSLQLVIACNKYLLAIPAIFRQWNFRNKTVHTMSHSSEWVRKLW